MARAKWSGDEIYAAAASWKERCLRRDGALFSDAQGIWSVDRLRRLEAVVGIVDESSGSFIGRLQGQVGGLSPEETQLAAEMLYVLLLPELDTGAEKKREHLEKILSLLPFPLSIPGPLDAALDAGGVANFAAAKAHRDAYMRFLARLVRQVKEMPPAERDALLDSPWKFSELVQSEQTSTDGMAANAIRHLLYPESFEYMVSATHRDQLVEAFAAAPGVAEADTVEEKIAAVRALTGDLDLYEDPFARIWKTPPGPRWPEAVEWSRRLYDREDFDAEERTYKLAVAQKVAAARAAVVRRDPGWAKALRAAFAGANNLIDWRVYDTFLRWCESNQDRAAEVLGRLWPAENADEPDLAQFLQELPQDALRGAGTRTSVASFLLLGVDPLRFAFYKPTHRSSLHRMLGLTADGTFEIDPELLYRPDDLAARLQIEGRRIRGFVRDTYPREDAEHGQDWRLTPEQAQAVVDRFGEGTDATAGDALYGAWMLLLDELRLRMLAQGTVLRDLLDAQGVAYRLVVGPIPEDWPDADRRALTAFRLGGPSAPGDETTISVPDEKALLPPPDRDLADRLHLPQLWLERMFALLEEKKQLILYGPPGTGKTFVAQHVGRHLAEQGGSVELVQFHPSYTYEDFFEGFRPALQEGGTLGFELVPGALREVAAAAAAAPERPHLLIIDEINRGNIAKIFGELYFLLEYRGESIRLQYSRDAPFTLPKNLYLLGTMNTADRSIALVDTALRRRFYFLGLIPTREPVKGVLGSWLAANGLDQAPADLLAALNDAIGDDEFSIGPSYLMTSTGKARDLERVWTYSILPVLEEHYYGSGKDVENEFGLAAIRKRVGAAADAPAEPDADLP